MSEPLYKAAGVPIDVPLGDIGETFGRFRVVNPKVERKLEASMKLYGQLSPAVALQSEAKPFELIDGFKRLRIARATDTMTSLRIMRVELGTNAAKVAIVQINRAAGRVSDFEESLVVTSLSREGYLTQFEIGRLFDRDQSWVSRRIAVTDCLCDEAKERIRLGLLGVASARELVHMPRGIQPMILTAIERHSMTSRETSRLVALLLKNPRTEWDRILRCPDEILKEVAIVLKRDSEIMPTKSGLCERLARLSAQCQAVRKDLGRLVEPVTAQDEIIEMGKHVRGVLQRTARDLETYVASGDGEVKGD